MSKWNSYFSGKRVWVTGAGGGLGRAMVEALADAGAEVAASDVRPEPLDELAQKYPTVHALPVDITDNAAVEEAAARAWDQLGSIDVLINNAGISQRAVFAESDAAVLRRIVEINLIGTMQVTRAVVGRMLAAGSGHLATVTSMAARVQTPLRTMYSAAKMGLHGMFDALRGEVGPQGIDVTLIIPGMVNTGISENAMTASGDPYGVTDKNQAKGMSPDECARRILAGIAAKRREFTVAMVPKLRLGQFLRRYLPGVYFNAISKVKVSGQ